MKRRAAVFMLALLVSACTSAAGQERGDARSRGAGLLAAGKPRAARVELLNAITADPANSATRIVHARVYLALSDGVAAEAELQRAQALGAPHDETRHLIAHARLLQRDADGALVLLVMAAPAHAAYSERVRGGALALKGDIGGAGAAFDRSAALSPDDPHLWMDLARFRRSTGDLGGAAAAADRAVALAPGSAAAIALRGELLRTQYGLAAALPWFDRALAIDPADVNIMAERAATLGELGRTNEMLAQTRAMLAASPGDPMAFYLQAVVAARARNFALARGLLDRAGGKLDELPAVMLLSGSVALATGDARRAIDRLKALVARQPDNGKAVRLLAAAQFAAADYAAAAASLGPIADRSDADSYVLMLLGRALLRAGEPASAAPYIARAARARSTPGALVDGAASPEVASTRAQLSSGGIAIAPAREIVAGHPGVPDAHLLLGDALSLAGDPRAAAGVYREAANLSFTEPAVLRLIEALEQSGDSAGATRVLQLFLEQNPRSIAARLLAANRFMANRQWSDAIANFEVARARMGDRDAALLVALAWAYQQDGAPDLALPIARKAWRLDTANPLAADTYGWLLVKNRRDVAAGLSLLQRARAQT